MEVRFLTEKDEKWLKVIDYAKKCSWKAGVNLACEMEQKLFYAWERVVVVLDHEQIAGFCTVREKDCISGLSYKPYIGYLFVDEKYRGQRLSEVMIHAAMDYIKHIGFKQVYLVSDHENLYEKYGFYVIDHAMASWGKEQKIYVHHLSSAENRLLRFIENELTAEEYIQLSAAVEFYEPSVDQTRRALENSLMTIKAVYNDKVVGMGRLVGDGAMYWFIQEVCVLPEYQGMGIGKSIINRMIEFVKTSGKPGDRVTVQLMAAKGKEEFYKKLGFATRPNEYSGPGMQKRFVIDKN